MQSNGDREPVSLAKCDNATVGQRWLLSGPSSSVMASGDPNHKMCLRPTNPPELPKSCVDGHGVMVGLNACLELTSTGQLSSPDCHGLCAVPASAQLALAACGQQVVWELVNTTVL